MASNLKGDAPCEPVRWIATLALHAPPVPASVFVEGESAGRVGRRRGEGARAALGGRLKQSQRVPEQRGEPQSPVKRERRKLRVWRKPTFVRSERVLRLVVKLA